MQKTKIINYLTRPEIERLHAFFLFEKDETYDVLTKDQPVKKSLRCFLIGCYTGLCFSALRNLTFGQISPPTDEPNLAVKALFFGDPTERIVARDLTVAEFNQHVRETLSINSIRQKYITSRSIQKTHLVLIFT